ncbi:sulfite exporter TauE/SafE family protein [Pleomorphomonas oryzae]|uniref:sulfite exporter TauE/SafE family protein n=1 Tax=Pleomorphomonas oryzae TaxID=261934 RepID=UPI0003FED589|nr:sulfite exporter TauE/SafE family protein [Pleomorphomonas oryzae]
MWIPADLTPATLTLLILTAFVAGLARGFSGFGAALIFMPVASALIGPRLAAPVILIIDAITTVGLVPDAFRRADRREVAVMSLGALVGVPTGVYLLTHLDPLTIRWAIIAICAVLLVLLLTGWRYHGRPKAPLTVGVGALSGLFSGASQVGGPPVIAYWLGGAIPANIVRANIVLYFEVSTTLTLLNYLWGGLFVSALVPLCLMTAPAYGLGLWGGSRLFGIASEMTFRHICLILIALAVVVGLPLFDGILR